MVMPGGGQIYNRQIIKGFAFFFWEHTLNYLGCINKAIYLDLNGHHSEALSMLDYQFALFYPAVYVLGVFDAFHDAKVENPNSNAGSFFILGGILGTLSLVFLKYFPYPLLVGGLCMIVPIMIGVILFRR
ncbi:hypothetical protein [Paenibacillus methanolicus]|uniref:hypothetical protein n=1 Tax=Paenibacillus methanolicus TaxID=582686 RepID=UPI0011E6FDC2|nr:hypothetical protein [Paenibacillus methanolicus]